MKVELGDMPCDALIPECGYYPGEIINNEYYVKRPKQNNSNFLYYRASNKVQYSRGQSSIYLLINIHRQDRQKFGNALQHGWSDP